MNDTAQGTVTLLQDKPILLQPDNHNKKYESSPLGRCAMYVRI